MSNLYDIFISYGRPDSRKFAIKLCNRLTALNYRVWFDVNDIPAGVDYQKHIDDGIEKSHNLLFIISPHSVNSDYCRLEIEQAIQFNKRIIPVFHVSSIDQDTWKQRNPEKPDEDWDMIKACNMHRGDDKNPNMHPVIAEINWFPSTSKNVECNFDEFIAELDEALHLHDDYLEKHTEYLVLALQWERNQRQSRYLLFQENRYDAEKWLKRRFADPHPRYVPTDLHCEYITESKKNAQNLMTQVFLAHASEDEPTMHMIRRSLQREGITVWVSSTDIQSGEDFRSAINRGIEQADTVVYLLSPDSQFSEYCRHELEYALSLNKRVIPILICPTEPELIPDELQSLQYIDLTKDRDAIAYQNENARLIKVLNEDASYFEAHKIFLSQAIKWEQGDRNPSMLLQGYNLTHAITWHKTAQLRSQYQPTPLQDEFIQMSQLQPPAQALDVFISYSRSDSDIARRLNEQLQRAGKRTWFDQESIASGANFQQEIYRGIENSDNFLFIISPRSITSPYCADEVEYAAKHNKRIVTLLHRQIDANDLHSTLKEIQWIDFENNRSDFSAGFNELIGTLDNDPQHLHTHTRLLVKALEWDTQGRSDCFLLHGEEIDHAEHWLNQSETKEPLPTGLQRDFVNSSRAAAQAQQRAQQVLKDAVKEGKRRVLLGTITMGVALAIAGITSIQTIQASGKLRLFNTFEELESAADHAMRQSEFDQIGSMVTAVEAAHELHTIANRQNLPDFADYETLRPFLALQQNLYPTGQRFVEQNRFDLMGSSTTAERSSIAGVSIDSENQTIATIDSTGTLQRWNFSGESQHPTLAAPSPREAAYRGEIHDMSTDGQTIATSGGDVVEIWSVHDLSQPPTLLLQQESYLSSDKDNDTYSFEGRAGQVVSMSLKSDAFDTVIALLDDDGNTLFDNDDSGDDTNSALIITLPYDGKYHVTVRGYYEDVSGVYQVMAQQNPIPETTISPESQTAIASVGMSPDGNYVAIASELGEVEIWSRSGELQQRLFTGLQSITDISLSNDETRIVTVSKDGTMRFWDRALASTSIPLLNESASLVANHSDTYSLEGKANETVLIQLSSDEFDTYLQVIDERGEIIRDDDDGGAGTNSAIAITLPDDGRYRIIAKGYDDTSFGAYQVSVWRSLSPETTIDTYRVADSQFSPDDQHLIATATDGMSLYILDSDGQRIQDLIGYRSPIHNIGISHDGQWLATTSTDGTAHIWQQIPSMAEEWSDSQELLTPVFDISPDHQHLATVASDGLIKIWDFAENPWNNSSSSDALIDITTRLQSPDKHANSNDPDHSDEEPLVKQNELDSSNGHHNGEHRFQGRANQSLSIRLESNDFDAYLQLFDESGNLIDANDDATADTLNSALDVILPSDGTYRLVASSYSDLGTGDYHLVATPLPNLKTSFGDYLDSSSNSYTYLTFSADGQYIASALSDGRVQVWTLAGEKRYEFSAGTESVNAISFVPNDSDESDTLILATASQDGELELWDLASLDHDPLLNTRGTLTGENSTSQFLDLHKFSIRGFAGQHISVQLDSEDFDTYLAIENSEGYRLAENDDSGESTNSSVDVVFPADGRYRILVTTYNNLGDYHLQVNITPSPDPIQTLQLHESPMTGISFSADGQLILSASQDGTAQLWDRSGKHQQSFLGHQGWVTHAQFSADEQQVLTASQDGTVRLWSLSGEPLNLISSSIGALTRAFFFSDDVGQHLVTISQDRHAQRWPLYQPNELLPLGCDRLSHYLNSPQSQSNLPEDDNLSTIRSICESYQ